MKKIISILISVVMLTGLITSVSFASQVLPSTFGWSAENEGYITLDVPQFNGDEIEYLLDLYKDGNLVNHDFGVFFDESGSFESEIFSDKIKELGNGVYKYKIGFERDFDTDILINSTDFSGEYVVNSFSHSVEVKPVVNTENEVVENNTEIKDNTEQVNISDNTTDKIEEEIKNEDNSPKSLIKGQIIYANIYPKKLVKDPVNYGEYKPLKNALITLYTKKGAKEPVQVNTNNEGKFELEYNQGDYVLKIIYGDTEMSVDVNACTEAVDLGTVKFEPYDYTSVINDCVLILPDDVNVIEITDDNFNDYFENVEVKYEEEKNSNMLINNQSSKYENVLGYLKGSVNNRIYRIGSSHTVFNNENNLWTISSFNMPVFNYGQSNAIYDEINNKLYYLSESGNNNGYVITNLEDNGSLVVTKFETTTFGNPTIYKVTDMTASFKKLPYVTVSYNGEFITFDQKPVIENGRTLVPVRAIFEKLGADVIWDGATQTVTATNGEITINLTIDNTEATKNGEKITLDVPAKIINNRTLVPVRFVSDCFGVNVDWNGDLQRVILTK